MNQRHLQKTLQLIKVINYFIIYVNTELFTKKNQLKQHLRQNNHHRIQIKVNKSRNLILIYNKKLSYTLETQYTITVKTGSVMSAGTDANVYITLNGDKDKIVRQHLETPQSRQNPFEKNSKDDFTIEDIDIGSVCFFYFSVFIQKFILILVKNNYY